MLPEHEPQEGGATLAPACQISPGTKNGTGYMRAVSAASHLISLLKPGRLAIPPCARDLINGDLFGLPLEMDFD